MLKQAHLFIKGDVLGVGFRAWTKIQAKAHDITGWVRNVYARRDELGRGASVEAMIQGEGDDLDQMIVVIKQGPPIARVDDVVVLKNDPKEIFDTFEIRKSPQTD